MFDGGTRSLTYVSVVKTADDILRHGMQNKVWYITRQSRILMLYLSSSEHTLRGSVKRIVSGLYLN